MRDRGRLFIFYPKTSQPPVWDTDVNHCCGPNLGGLSNRAAVGLDLGLRFSVTTTGDHTACAGIVRIF